ncbi:MAG: DGQHR domain-containing protein [Kofleriaceae bacterium]
MKKPKKKSESTPPATSRSYPALLLRQNKHRFYFTTIPVDDLFDYCFVARRKEDPKLGFQRELNEERANDISRYLAAGDGSIPTNIVLSAQTEARFAYTRSTKTVSFKRTPGAFLVLDGQHRLWGYHKCPLRHRVPVAIYQELDRESETKLFIDINTTQRGVPAALLLDIKSLAAIESGREKILRDLFDRFKSDSKSPLHGKLSPAKSLAGKISRVTFNRAVSQTLNSNHMTPLDGDMRYRVLLNYLNSFDAELAADNKKALVRSAFFEAIFDIFDDVLRETIARKGNLKVDSLRETIQPLASIDMTASTSQPTKRTIVLAMRTALNKSSPISSGML